MSPTAWIRRTVEQRIEEIVDEARTDKGRYRKLLAAARPTDRPQRVKRSPAPWFHCASPGRAQRAHEGLWGVPSRLPRRCRALAPRRAHRPLPRTLLPAPETVPRRLRLTHRAARGTARCIRTTRSEDRSSRSTAKTSPYCPHLDLRGHEERPADTIKDQSERVSRRTSDNRLARHPGQSVRTSSRQHVIPARHPRHPRHVIPVIPRHPPGLHARVSTVRPRTSDNRLARYPPGPEPRTIGWHVILPLSSRLLTQIPFSPGSSEARRVHYGSWLQSDGAAETPSSS